MTLYELFRPLSAWFTLMYNGITARHLQISHWHLDRALCQTESCCAVQSLLWKIKKIQRRTFCQSSRKVCFSLLGTCEAKRRFWLDLASQSHRWSLSRYKTLGGIVGHVQSICFLIQDLLISTWIIIPHPDQIVNNKPASGKLVACGLKQQNLRLLVGPVKYFSQIFAMLFPQLLFFLFCFFVTIFLIFSCIVAGGQLGFICVGVMWLLFPSWAFWNFKTTLTL